MWMSPIFRCSAGPTLLLLTVCCLGLSGCSNMADESAAPPEATALPADHPTADSSVARLEPDRREVKPQPVQVAPLAGSRPDVQPIVSSSAEPIPYMSSAPPAYSPRMVTPLSPQPAGSQPRMISGPVPSVSQPDRTMIREPLPAMASPGERYPLERRAVESPLLRTLPDESPSGSSGLGDAVPASPISPESDPDYPEVVASETTSTEQEYELVTVFYGTDRKAEMVSASGPQPYEKWLHAMVISAAMALLSIVVMFRRPGKTIATVATVSLIATAVLSVITVVTRMQSATMAVGPERTYGPQRGTLQMGNCQVSIPKRHQVGEVERPSVFKFEFVEDPRKHVVLLSVDRQPEDRFFADLKTRVDGSRRKEAFVFIHGYNVTFAAAARRTAQLAHDLRFDGAPIFYSWPSQGGLLRYTVDETNAAWTIPNLKRFLLAVAERSGAESVHLIAHSMGNLPLTASLQALADEFPDGRHLFREVILTAPDIDAEVFRRDIAPAIIRTADRVTLYASSNDKALNASKQFHGYPRAGESGENLVIVPGVDTVDVSAIDSSLIGHSYYGSNDTVVADMVDLLVASKPPDLRPWLKQARFGQGRYWVFLVDRASDGTAGTGAFPARR
jgi:esterase/lipase superfamily enzyme